MHPGPTGVLFATGVDAMELEITAAVLSCVMHPWVYLHVTARHHAPLHGAGRRDFLHECPRTRRPYEFPVSRDARENRLWLCVCVQHTRQCVRG